MELVKRITAREFYKEYYTSLNGILKLTDLELNLLCLLSFIKNRHDEILNPSIRKAISKELNISMPSLNNYLKILRKKKVLLLNNNKYNINEKIYIPLNKKEYEINFKFLII